MRVSQDEKNRSHDRIVASASRLLRERGIDGTGVSDVMSAAGLTHGGFYRHFDSKEALLQSALEVAFSELTDNLDARLAGHDAAEAIAGFQAYYLHDNHVQNPGMGCPVAALAGEIARASSQLRAAFGAGVNRIVARLGRGMRGPDAKRREAATRRLAMMAGAVMIARASDPETARAVLAACRADNPTRSGRT